jgi:FXSXX-COOH protein
VDEPLEWVPLIDVRGLPVTDLFAGDPVLDRTLRRLVADLEDPDAALSAFSSFAS